MNKPTRVLILSVTLLVIGMSTMVTYLAWSFIFKSSSGESNPIVYEVTPQKSFKTISDELNSKNLIKSSYFFNIYARMIGLRSKIKVGEYALNTNMRPSEILSILTSGKSIFRNFTIPEGYNIFEQADLFEKNGYAKKGEFLSLVKDKTFIKELFSNGLILNSDISTLEGYLYPETYQVTKYMGLKEIILAQIKLFKKNFDDALKQKEINNLTPEQVLILSSIIEKETGNPKERPLISSVFHNRMAKSMKLQTDPTIIYGKSLALGKVEDNITKTDLSDSKNIYNTYVIPSLPPGPISSPGKDSFLAAVQPAKTQFLYFVSQNDGTTRFTESLEVHNKNVKETQLDPKARQGKSWRDLKSKLKKDN